jgi:HEAT repeat protein
MDERKPAAEFTPERHLNSEIQWRIERLNSLVEGEQARMELVGFGAAAIQPLKEFLFSGRPSGIFQPRQWAVEALGILGAKDVLLEYLRRDERIPDPVVQHGEEAVRNTAARLIARWKTDDVFELLIELAHKRILSGIVTALGSFRRKEALPILERALEDDVARPAAEEALAGFGGEEIEILVSAVHRKRMNEDEEVPSSRRRRRSAAELLSNSRLEPVLWPQLRFLLDEDDSELVIHGAKIATVLAPDSEKTDAVASVLRVLPDSPWYLKEEATKCLEALYLWGELLIENQITWRSEEPPLKRISDETLLTLLRLRAHMQDPCRPKGCPPPS